MSDFCIMLKFILEVQLHRVTKCQCNNVNFQAVAKMDA